MYFLLLRDIVTSCPPREALAKVLNAAVKVYQTTQVIPHCQDCLRPCCKLDSLVLELRWKQVKAFWQICETRAAFDRDIGLAKGPKEIRKGNGLYYIHGAPCPSFDHNQKNCRIYKQGIMPRGCKDFPVYLDRGEVIADLRCEAVDLKSLIDLLFQSIGQGFELVQSADTDFPFMVSLAIRQTRKR